VGGALSAAVSLAVAESVAPESVAAVVSLALVSSPEASATAHMFATHASPALQDPFG
jgi:hypothetical protein